MPWVKRGIMSQSRRDDTISRAHPARVRDQIRVREIRDRLKNRSGKAAKPPRSLFLVGFMGAGKTSVGRVLGQRLNWAFEDLDDRIKRLEGRTVPEIFRDSGETEFRRAEHAALQSVLNELQAGAVKIVALGGGAFVQEKNAALLKSAGVPTVFLDAPVEELWQRCCQQASEASAERPLLRSIDQFRVLYKARRKSYVQASLQVSTGGRSLDEIASDIAQKLGLSKIEISTREGEIE